MHPTNYEAGIRSLSHRVRPYVSETRALTRLIWPLVIAQMAQMGTGVVDTIMAGRYNVADLAAIAIGYNIWLPVHLFVLGLMLATTAIVAQDFGGGKVQRIKELLPQSLWLALVLGLVAGPICYFSSPILMLLDLSENSYSKSLAYLQAVAFGLPASAIFQALRCHTQGIGIMKPFAIASVIGFFINIPLNYAFIYGEWGAPEMGAAGCGWATAISMWSGPILVLFYIGRSEKLKPYMPALKFVAPEFGRMKEIVRLGLPIGLTMFFEVGVFSVIALLIATMGIMAMASHQIALNVWEMVYMLLMSIGAAMATRVGHAIGSGDHHAVRLAVRCGTIITILSGCVVMALILASPSSIINVYTDDESIFSIAIVLVRLSALFIILDAVHIAASATLRAFKDTRFAFVVMTIAYWVVALPLGYWLGMVKAGNPEEGTIGFWTAMIVGIFVACILMVWRQQKLMRRLPPLGLE